MGSREKKKREKLCKKNVNRKRRSLSLGKVVYTRGSILCDEWPLLRHNSIKSVSKNKNRTGRVMKKKLCIGSIEVDWCIVRLCDPCYSAVAKYYDIAN